MISNIDRYMKFFKNPFLTDRCRNLSFLDRYMKIFISIKLGIWGFYTYLELRKNSYIHQYINSYIGLYKNSFKTLGDLPYIDLYTNVKPRTHFWGAEIWNDLYQINISLYFLLFTRACYIGIVPMLHWHCGSLTGVVLRKFGV